MVDHATRYPEAQPLKDSHVETVAEALVNMEFPEDFKRPGKSVFVSCYERSMQTVIS